MAPTTIPEGVQQAFKDTGDSLLEKALTPLRIGDRWGHYPFLGHSFLANNLLIWETGDSTKLIDYLKR